MLFVIDKPQFQRVISIVRDDRRKKDQGLNGPFLRLEAGDDYVKLDGLEVSGKIPATVYEPGVLFLKATQFRRLLPTFKGEKFLTIQVTGDELLMGYVRMPLEANEMLLYPNPDQAPPVHPAVALEKPAAVNPGPARKRKSAGQSHFRQLTLWDETDLEVRQDDER
jgi:hypothetical protein